MPKKPPLHLRPRQLDHKPFRFSSFYPFPRRILRSNTLFVLNVRKGRPPNSTKCNL